MTSATLMRHMRTRKMRRPPEAPQAVSTRADSNPGRPSHAHPSGHLPAAQCELCSVRSGSRGQLHPRTPAQSFSTGGESSLGGGVHA